MATATLVIEDEVNLTVKGADVVVRRKMSDALKFYVPGARFSPAVKMGRWDGTKTFCDIGGRTYINLLDKILPILEKSGYDFVLEDKRPQYDFDLQQIESNSYSHICWPTGHPLAGESITVKDHQVAAVNTYLGNPHGVQILPTSAGKTIITAILSHRVEQYGRSVVIVPTKDLVTQTEEDYKNFGLDVGVFYGDRKDIDKQHTICTWQSLDALDRKKKSDDDYDGYTVTDFFDGVACVIVDECHKAKSDALCRILGTYAKHVPIRWGLTGTMPESDLDKTAVVSCVGPVLDRLHAKELQEQGILANLHIHINQLNDLAPVSVDYASEVQWLSSDRKRMTYISEFVTKIAESGNTLILVDRVAAGEILHEMLPDSVFISGTVKSSERKKEYKEVQNVDNKIIIATYGVASTGISINRIFNLVLVEPGKSFVKVIQSIGRGLRVAKDKDFVNVYDICSNAKYSRRHLTARKKFYDDAQYPYTIDKIDYSNTKAIPKAKVSK